MTITDFTYLIEHPNKVVDPLQVKQLEDIIEEYPYFQVARALHLKGLKNLNSYKYNKALKITAAFTSDRDVLFDLITSKDFLRYESPISDENSDTAEVPRKLMTIEDSEPSEPESPMQTETVGDVYEQEPLEHEEKQQVTAEVVRPLIEASEDQPLPRNEKDAENILDPGIFTSKEVLDKEKTNLEMGKPLNFDAKEKFSFNEWLQLASKKKMDRDKKEETGLNKPATQEQSPKASTRKRQKFDRIDKFIADNPKIVPQKNIKSTIDLQDSIKIDKNELMTETLARVYLEQKKYKKAIQAYKILSLKYPEKSGFFADRIKSVQKIQQENK